jgi:hypothetical protein
VNASTTGSMAISRKSIPSDAASRCASPRVPSDEYRDGMDTPCTRSAPIASTHNAAVSAESIPPESPMTTSPKPFFVT